MSTGQEPSEEELRAAYEAEIKSIRIEQVLLEQVVSLVNLGMRKTGLSPGTEDERDLGQVRVAIDAVRALMPLMDQTAAAQAGAIRDALSQLQMAYVRLGGTPDAAGAPAPPPGAGAAGPGGAAGPAGPGGPTPPPPPPAEAPDPEGRGPAQRSGRLWIPGQ